MNLSDEIRTIVEEYIDKYVTGADLGYQLTVNSTYSAVNIKILGVITDSPTLVQQAVLTGFKITKLVVPLGYKINYNLSDVINPKINYPAGTANIEIAFSYETA